MGPGRANRYATYERIINAVTDGRTWAKSAEIGFGQSSHIRSRQTGSWAQFSTNIGIATANLYIYDRNWALGPVLDQHRKSDCQLVHLMIVTGSWAQFSTNIGKVADNLYICRHDGASDMRPTIRGRGTGSYAQFWTNIGIATANSCIYLRRRWVAAGDLGTLHHAGILKN